jgi:hypothetical protein
MLEAIRLDWERYEPSRQPVIDRATILGGVNEQGGHYGWRVVSGRKLTR